MSGFPSLKPAFTVRLNPDQGFEIGSVSGGESLSVVPIKSGSITSEAEYPVDLDADVVFGSDHVTVEATKTHVRINVNSVLRNKIDGALISYSYKGVIEIDQSFMAIFLQSPDARTTEFGKIFTQITIQAGNEKLKQLEYATFVGSARFVVVEGGYYIETKVSQVVG